MQKREEQSDAANQDDDEDPKGMGWLLLDGGGGCRTRRYCTVLYCTIRCGCDAVATATAALVTHRVEEMRDEGLLE